MNNALLYMLTVLIWGSTWIAIKYQLGSVSPLVSIGHRFMLAALMIFAWLLLSRRLQRLGPRDHLAVFLQGMALFCINYRVHLLGHRAAGQRPGGGGVFHHGVFQYGDGQPVSGHARQSHGGIGRGDPACSE